MRLTKKQKIQELVTQTIVIILAFIGASFFMFLLFYDDFESFGDMEISRGSAKSVLGQIIAKILFKSGLGNIFSIICVLAITYGFIQLINNIYEDVLERDYTQAKKIIHASIFIVTSTLFSYSVSASMKSPETEILNLTHNEKKFFLKEFQLFRSENNYQVNRESLEEFFRNSTGKYLYEKVVDRLYIDLEKGMDSIINIHSPNDSLIESQIIKYLEARRIDEIWHQDLVNRELSKLTPNLFRIQKIIVEGKID